MKFIISQNGFQLATAKTALSAFEKARKMSYLFSNVKVEKKK